MIVGKALGGVIVKSTLDSITLNSDQFRKTDKMDWFIELYERIMDVNPHYIGLEGNVRPGPVTVNSTIDTTDVRSLSLGHHKGECIRATHKGVEMLANMVKYDKASHQFLSEGMSYMLEKCWTITHRRTKKGLPKVSEENLPNVAVDTNKRR